MGYDKRWINKGPKHYGVLNYHAMFKSRVARTKDLEFGDGEHRDNRQPSNVINSLKGGPSRGPQDVHAENTLAHWPQETLV